MPCTKPSIGQGSVTEKHDLGYRFSLDACAQPDLSLPYCRFHFYPIGSVDWVSVAR